MGQTTNEIAAHIDSKRAELGSNLEALERKVKAATDWKRQYQLNTLPILGVAFGGGVLLATMLRSSNNRRRVADPFSTDGRAGAPGSLYLWHNVKGALANVAAAAFTDYVAKLVPGFRDQFEKIQSAYNAPNSGKP